MTPLSKVQVFDTVRVTSYGKGAEAYWILEPKRRVDKPLPVVLFVHGLNQTDYSVYRSWIMHLVRSGNVVIYPRYQAGNIVDPATFTGESAKALHRALDRCDGQQHPQVDHQQLSMIGHSVGGTIIANLAARPEYYGIPVPRALMLLQPGDTRADQGLGALLPTLTEDHRTIAKGTLMLIVDVANDYFVSPKAGQRIYEQAIGIDAKDKRRLLMQTDAHGKPALIADHMLPMGWTNRQDIMGRVNVYDDALWRWFDAMQAVGRGDDSQREEVFGEATLDLGKWSDGTPVRRPMDVSSDRLER